MLTVFCSPFSSQSGGQNQSQNMQDNNEIHKGEHIHRVEEGRVEQNGMINLCMTGNCLPAERESLGKLMDQTIVSY